MLKGNLTQCLCKQGPLANPSGQERIKPLQPKPIYTSPCKTGSYGFNKTTLSERAGARGVVRQLLMQNALGSGVGILLDWLDEYKGSA